MIDGYSWTYRMCASLHRSVRRAGRALGGRDALPDALRRDLRIEPSLARRMADQEARLRADALASI